MLSKEEKAQSIKKLLNKVNDSSIASIKSTVSGVVSIINDPKSNAKNLKELIQVDPPLAAKVLKVANSAYYASPRQISEIDQAVIWIGFDTLKEIVLNQKIAEVFNSGQAFMGYSRNALWKHSLSVAILAKMMYRMEYGERGENAYAVGLMHDIGIIVEDQFMQENFRKVLTKAHEDPQLFTVLEREILGFDHAEIGKVLTYTWGLPSELVGAIGFHHSPMLVTGEYEKMAKTLYIADFLTIESGINYSESPKLDMTIYDKCLTSLKLKQYSLDSLVKQMEKEISKMEAEGFLSND